MVKSLIFCFIFAQILLLGQCNLRCYDCGGSQDGEACTNPKTHNVKSTICLSDTNTTATRSFIKKRIYNIEGSEVAPRSQGINKTFECYSFSYRSSNDSSQNGIYRGCLEIDNSVQESCNFLSELLEGEILDCFSCELNNCNVHELRGGAVAISASLTILLVNVLICMLLVKLE